jgi:hypothetical protein
VHPSGRNRRRPRLWAAALVIVATAAVGLLFVVMTSGSQRREYGYSTAQQHKYNIVELIAERQPQPWMSSIGDLRDYLRSEGLGCSHYRVDPDLFPGWGSDEPSAHCTGTLGQVLWLQVHDSAEGKSDDLWTVAGQCPDSGYEYWVEGPNWTISIMEPPGNERVYQPGDLAHAQRTARTLGARLERSCSEAK